MANLVIKTADELGANDVEARAGARRAARETPVLRAVLRLFADSGGPVNVVGVADSLAGAEPEAIANTLATLSDDDLLILHGGSIELAYPFSTAPTPFVMRRADGRERFTCCALDALGIARGSPVARSTPSASRRCSMKTLRSQPAAITATNRYGSRLAQTDHRQMLTTS